MSAPDAPGTVRDLGTGRTVGRTASIETTFAEAVERRKETVGRVYVVVGPDSSEGFRSRLAEICPVVVDEDARSVCLLIDGDASEWLGRRAR